MAKLLAARIAWAAPTTRCRSTAATASPSNTRSPASSATPASSPSSRAPPRSRPRSSPAACSSPAAPQSTAPSPWPQILSPKAPRLPTPPDRRNRPPPRRRQRLPRQPRRHPGVEEEPGQRQPLHNLRLPGAASHPLRNAGSGSSRAAQGAPASRLTARPDFGETQTSRSVAAGDRAAVEVEPEAELGEERQLPGGVARRPVGAAPSAWTQLEAAGIELRMRRPAPAASRRGARSSPRAPPAPPRRP